MAGISGQSVAQTIAKNLSNLIESEKGAISASKSAYIDSQNSDKTAEIGPIYIKLNDPENDTGNVLSDGDSISPGDTAASRQKEREKNDAEIAVLDTQIFAKQAEIDASLFAPEADGSQFSGAKQSETQSKLTDTYQSGDTGLARQLESRTYGVDSDKNLTPPGYETKFIDEFSDTHGTSKQTGVVDLQKVTTDNEFFGNTTKYVSDAAAKSIEILANNQKVSDEKSAEALALLGLEKTNNANIEVDIPYSDGKLQSLVDEAANGVPYVPYKQDPEGGTSENNLTGQTVYNPRKLELEREREDAAKAAQAKIDLEISNRLAFQDSLMAEQKKVTDGIAEGGAGKVGVASPNILSEERLQANLKRQEEGFQDVINGTTAADIKENISSINPNNQQLKSVKKTPLAVKEEKTVVPPFKTLEGNAFGLAGNDPFRFSTLAYPLDVTTDMTNGHYVLFYVNVQNKTKYRYNGYNDDGNKAVIGDVVETAQRVYGPGAGPRAENVEELSKYKTIFHQSKGADAGDVPYQQRQIASGKKGNILQSNQVTLMRQRKATTGLASQLDLTSRITDSVALYLPANVSDSTSTTYNASNTGMAGYLALSGGSVLEKIRTHDFEGAADEFMGMGGTVLYDMIRKAGIGAFGAATGGQGVQANFDKAFGQTMNPFIEVAFDSMGVRSFNYTFDFRPRNAPETAEVQAIIQLFRFHMVPELKGTNHRYMTLPSTFDIHYMYQTDRNTTRENSFYHKIATCVLEDCTVDYTPDGVKSFDSGAPTHTNMTLRFKETEMLTKEKIQQGF